MTRPLVTTALGPPDEREDAEGMARVHHQGLLITHLRQVFHGEPVLCPVLEDGAVAAIGDELMRVLGHCRVKVVGYHQHYGSSLQ